MPGATTFLFGPPKKSVSNVWVIFQGSPLFLVVSGHSPITSISTLILGLFQQNLVDICGPSQNDQEWRRIRSGPNGETVVFTFSRKVFFWPKMGFIPKSIQNFLRSLLESRSDLFFFFFFGGGGEISVFGPIIQFLPYDPNFIQRPVCSPRRDRSFPPLGASFWLFVTELWPFS